MELEKQLEKANDVIKRLEMEIKQMRKTATNGQIDLKLITEDQAALLAKAEQEKVQMIKEYAREIDELRGKVNADNRIWMERFDIRKGEF